MHLQGRLENVLPGHGMELMNPVTPHPPFRLGLRSERRYRAAKRRAGVENLFQRYPLGAGSASSAVVDMLEQIGPTDQLFDAAQAALLENLHELDVPGMV